MIRGSVSTATRNGTNQIRYQGYTSGAERSAAAIGQAHASGDARGSRRRAHAATARPTPMANAVAAAGPASDSTPEKTGPLKRKRPMISGRDPRGTWRRSQKGTYSASSTASPA